MKVEQVTTLADPRLAWYRGVTDPALLRDGQRFVAEGRIVVARLLEDCRWDVESVLVSPAALETIRPCLENRADVPVFVVGMETLMTLTGFNIHRGCLAIGFRRTLPTPADLIGVPASPVLLLGLEGLADADNVGACFRNAAAFGVQGVILDEACTDPLYRKAIRTSMAATLQIPFARTPSWVDLVASLRAQDILVFGLTPSTGSQELEDLEAEVLRSPRLIVLVGNERVGLSSQTLRACDRRIRIGMVEGVDSLNAATAAAIALHTLARARTAPVRRRGSLDPRARPEGGHY